MIESEISLLLSKACPRDSMIKGLEDILSKYCTIYQIKEYQCQSLISYAYMYNKRLEHNLIRLEEEE